jgi:hypothetical protein
MTVEERIAQLRTECDNYDRALQALKALTHELLWDSANKVCTPDSVASFGRRMHSTPSNRVAPSRKLTPDMVAQVGGGHSYVIELKASVPENEAHRRERLEEVQKYDDDLTGWLTPTPSHDLLLLIDYANHITVKEDIEAMEGAGCFRCNRPFAIVSFTLQPRGEATWIMLQLVHGRLSNGSKHTTLHRICSIHPENLKANPLFGGVLLYDANPPLPLLLIRMYEAVNSNFTEEESLRLRTEGQVTKTYVLSELKEQIADYCCPLQTDQRVPKLPETAWIKRALKVWLDMGWAIKSPNVPGSYDIVVKKARRTQPFEQFLKVCSETDVKALKRREKEQLKQKKLDEKYRQKYPLLALLEDAANERPDGNNDSGNALESAT